MLGVRRTNDLRASKALLQALRCGVVSSDIALGVDVTNICGDTRRSLDVVECELRSVELGSCSGLQR